MKYFVDSAKTDEAEEAFVRAAGRYVERGFLPRAIAMAKLAATLNPAHANLLASPRAPRAGGDAADATVRASTEAVLLRLPAAKFSSLAAMYPPMRAALVESAEQPLRPSLLPK